MNRALESCSSHDGHRRRIRSRNLWLVWNLMTVWGLAWPVTEVLADFPEPEARRPMPPVPSADGPADPNRDQPEGSGPDRPSTNPTPLEGLPPSELVRIGNEALRTGDIPRAIQVYERAAEQAPDAAEVVFDRGLAQYLLGDYESARSLFERAATTPEDTLGTNAAYGVATTHHAEALKASDNPREAVKSLEQAITGYQNVLSSRPGHATAREALYKAASTRRRLIEQLRNQPEPGDPQQGESGEGEQGRNDQQLSRDGDANSKSPPESAPRDDGESQPDRNEDSTAPPSTSEQNDSSSAQTGQATSSSEPRGSKDETRSSNSESNPDQKMNTDEAQRPSDSQSGDSQDRLEKNSGADRSPSQHDAADEGTVGADQLEGASDRSDTASAKETLERDSREQAERRLRELMQNVRNRQGRRAPSSSASPVPVEKDW